jgi:hypothetical protein
VRVAGARAPGSDRATKRLGGPIMRVGGVRAPGSDREAGPIVGATVARASFSMTARG